MVNILRLTVAYLNATINVIPETQNRRLEPTGPAKPDKTRGLTGTGPGLARQESVGRVLGRFWNQTDRFLRSKPGPLAGYPDPLLTLPTDHTYYELVPDNPQWPWQGFGHCIYCDELGPFRTCCPDVSINLEQDIDNLNECGRLTLGPRGGSRGEICGYRLQRRFLSMWEYTGEVAQHWQPAGGVASMVTP